MVRPRAPAMPPRGPPSSKAASTTKVLPRWNAVEPPGKLISILK